MNPHQLYRCPDCGAEQRLPESPTTGPKRIQMGCADCGRLRSWEAVGRQGPKRRSWR